VAAVADRAHKAGAHVAVDAVHAAHYLPKTASGWEPDIITCSAYTVLVPTVGVTA
jgi:selenocysteine lyase/cysteine desulfurase